MEAATYINNAHPEYLETLYKDYKIDPQSVDTDFKKFFEGFDFAVESGKANEVAESGDFSIKELKVYQLIEAYRERAHLLADTNPIRKRKDRKPHLDIKYFGLSDKDMETAFSVGSEIQN